MSVCLSVGLSVCLIQIPIITKIIEIKLEKSETSLLIFSVLSWHGLTDLFHAMTAVKWYTNRYMNRVKCNLHMEKVLLLDFLWKLCKALVLASLAFSIPGWFCRFWHVCG